MTNSVLKNRVNKLLSFKNKDYQRKYYILSRLSESDLSKNENIFEEFKCLVRSLNLSNGEIPSDNYIIEFLKKNISKKQIAEIKESVNLKYSNNIKDFDSLINEELDKINYINKELDIKLENILIKSVKDNISLLESRVSRRRRRRSQEDDLDQGPSFEELKSIEDELSQDTIDNDLSSEDDFDKEELLDDSYEKISNNVAEPIKSIEKKVKSKEERRLPKGPSNNKIAKALGFTGTGKYVPGQKSAVMSPWEQLLVYVSNKLHNTGIASENDLSLLAKRKLWIVMSIQVYLTLESQSNMMLGISDNEKSRMLSKLDTKQKVDVKNAVSQFRQNAGFGRSLSNNQIDQIIKDTKKELSKGDYDLESELIKESELLKLLVRSASARNKSFNELKSEVDIMYPLGTSHIADFDLEPRMSDEELEKLKQQNIEFDKRYEDELDQDDNGSSEDSINVKDKLEDLSKNRNLSMTYIEYNKYVEDISKDLLRLEELYKKSVSKINPDIFNPIEKDESGNIINIPDVIPGQDLSDSEIEEINKILEKLSYKDKISIIDLDKKGEFYDELYNKYSNIEDVIKRTQEYSSRFGLDNKEQFSDADIARVSYGQFKGTPAVRQLAQKAWTKEMFYSCNPDEKARIYATAADRWTERLVKLDLIDDKAFVRIPSKEEGKDDKAIPSKVLDQLEMQGKYKRSDKLKDTSEYFAKISRYLTNTSLIKKYFDENRDDSLRKSIEEKLNSIRISSESQEDYEKMLSDLEKEDKEFASYLVLEASFNGNSGFRSFVTGLLDDFFTKDVWSKLQSNLYKSIKEYFDINYGKDIIAPNLRMDNPRITQIKPEEGQNLFPTIVNVVMKLSGMKSAASKGLSKVSVDPRESQRSYFLNPGKGNFKAKVDKLNANRSDDMKIKGIDGGDFSEKDVNKLLDDMFNPNGIIGSVYEELKILSKDKADELINHIYSMSDKEIDDAIVKGLASNEFVTRTDFDVFIPKVINLIGKDSKEAIKNYKKMYGSLLIGKDFADYLDSEYGFETVNLKSK